MERGLHQKKLTEVESPERNSRKYSIRQLYIPKHPESEMSAAAASENMVGSSLAVSGRISVGEILAVMKAASDGEMADLMGEMFRGNLIFQERCRVAGTLEEEKEVSEEVAATPVKAAKAAKAPAAPKKAPKEKKVAAAAAAEGEEPTAASYRLEASEIKADRCQARKTEGGEDRNWKPIVYRESQCPKAPVEGEELCKGCALLFEKESQDDKFKKWHGLVTEDLLDHTHILGSDWATKKCKWVGSAPVSAPVSVATGTAPESAAASEGEAEGEAPSSPPPSPAPAAAAKAPAAPKAAKAPAAPKAAKAPAAKKEAPAKKEEPKPAAAAAAAVSEPVAEAGELNLFGGEFYWVAPLKVNGKTLSQAFNYDQIEQLPGDFAGRVRADESLDTSVGEIRSIGGEFYWIVRSEVEKEVIHQVYDYDHAADKKGDFVGRLKKDGSIDGDAEEVEVE